MLSPPPETATAIAGGLPAGAPRSMYSGTMCAIYSGTIRAIYSGTTRAMALANFSARNGSMTRVMKGSLPPGPWRAAAPEPMPGARLLAPKALDFLVRAADPRALVAREFLLELLVGQASVLLLAELGKRKAELQQGIRRLGAVRVILVALRKHARGLLVVAAHIIGFGKPVLRVRRQRVRGIERHEA